eukprot:TRINITY_DN62009_c0_g1_i1.p1 TRINITY_DN62009_c0_g1~~TRINITY_DN62009_c0_g1_i1.p1  ORF type:complete len:712 (-),score=171.66 TRINITY_DN62009_c0_g1_i1:435-2570(-)
MTDVGCSPNSKNSGGFGSSLSLSEAWSIRCTGYNSSSSEYRFCASHRSGCTWAIQRSFQDLSDLDKALCLVFGVASMPSFPPRLSGGGVVAAIFGSAGTRPEVVAERERLLQTYFDGLCARDDVTRTACFQVALGVKVPEPVAQLRVINWLPPTSDGEGVSAFIAIRPESPGDGTAAVVDVYQLTAKLVFEDAVSGGEELAPVAELLVPSSSNLIRVPDLAFGHQVEFEVVAKNSVGRSSPVAIRSMTPQFPADCEKSTLKRESLESLESDLDRRRAELEAWWSHRRDDVERANAERERHVAEIRSEQETLKQERTSLVMEREALGEIALALPHSPSDSPQHRAESREQWESELRALRLQQQDMTKQLEEMFVFREEHEYQAVFIAEERERFVVERQAEQARVEQELMERFKTEGTSKLEEKYAKQSEELREQQEEQRAQARHAAEVSLAFAKRVSEQEAELERRAAEMVKLEARHEADMKKSEEQLSQDEAALHRDRAELQQQRQEQQAAAVAADMACSSRAEHFEEQRGLLEEERIALERCRAASQAERHLRLEELLRQTAELENEHMELQNERQVAEERARQQAADFRNAEEEIEERARILGETETSLSSERVSLMHSRRHLALVQAHVMSMIDQAGSGTLSQHRLDSSMPHSKSFKMLDLSLQQPTDDDDEADAGDAVTSDMVWSMDWNSVVGGDGGSRRSEDDCGR